MLPATMACFRLQDVTISMRRFFTLSLIFLISGFACKAAAQSFAIVSGNRFVDQSGRTITVDRPFTRIISLYAAHTENLFKLGLDEEIVGVSRSENYPVRAMTKKAFSYHDGPEKFLAARPDAVLIRPMIDRGYPDLLRQLENSGVTVVSIQPSSIDEMFEYWQILGILTGRQAAAERMKADFRQGVDRAIGLTRTIDPKKRVYFEAIHDKMKTFTPTSMAIFALETAGGINIAADASQVRRTNIAYYGKERILSKGAQIDVYLAQTGSMNRPTVASIIGEPGYQVIKAVRTRQVFIIEEAIVSRPTMRLLAGIFEIGNRLYPDVFNQTVRSALKIE